jgi:hypothetical protein
VAKHIRSKRLRTPKGVEKAEDVEQRRKQAIELRIAGATYEAIAKQVGYCDRTAAYRAVRDGLAAIPREAADALRNLENDRLDRIFLGLWQKARSGDKDAINGALNVMARRAKLLGLDAPTKVEQKVEQTTEVTATPADAKRIMAELFGTMHKPNDPETPNSSKSSE